MEMLTKAVKHRDDQGETRQARRSVNNLYLGVQASWAATAATTWRKSIEDGQYGTLVNGKAMPME
jgi:hypothetical protein